MSSVTLKGKPVLLKGDIPPAGDTAPDFTFVKEDLTEASLYDIDAPVKVILSVPSLDTGTCAAETKRFNTELDNLPGVHTLVISMDLPFAMKRFCEAEGINNITIASDYRYKDFSQEYNVEILDGKLKGLNTRAVFVIDPENEVRYSELVPEIGDEPDYDSAMKVVKKLAAKS